MLEKVEKKSFRTQQIDQSDRTLFDHFVYLRLTTFFPQNYYWCKTQFEPATPDHLTLFIICLQMRLLAPRTHLYTRTTERILTLYPRQNAGLWKTLLSMRLQMQVKKEGGFENCVRLTSLIYYTFAQNERKCVQRDTC